MLDIDARRARRGLRKIARRRRCAERRRSRACVLEGAAGTLEGGGFASARGSWSSSPRRRRSTRRRRRRSRRLGAPLPADDAGRAAWRAASRDALDPRSERWALKQLRKGLLAKRPARRRRACSSRRRRTRSCASPFILSARLGLPGRDHRSDFLASSSPSGGHTLFDVCGASTKRRAPYPEQRHPPASSTATSPRPRARPQRRRSRSTSIATSSPSMTVLLERRAATCARRPRHTRSRSPRASGHGVTQCGTEKSTRRPSCCTRPR